MVLRVLTPYDYNYPYYYMPKVQSRLYRPGGSALQGTLKLEYRKNRLHCASFDASFDAIILLHQ